MGAVDAPSSGEVFLDGREISRLSDEGLSEIRLRDVGFIHQFFHLMPTMTAYENVALPLMLQGVKRADIKGCRNAWRAVGLRTGLRRLPEAALGRRDAARGRRARHHPQAPTHPRR